jgi:hypothetical protein
MSSSYWKDHESKISSVVPGPRNRRPMQRASENSKSDSPSTKSSSKTNAHQHDDNSHAETTATTAEKSSNKRKLQKAAVLTTTPLAPPLAPSSPASSTDPPTSTSDTLSSNAPAAHAEVDTAPAPMALVAPASAHAVVPEMIVPAPTTAVAATLLSTPTSATSDVREIAKKKLFLDLSNTDPCIVAVNTNKGIWIQCTCRTRKKMQNGHPFLAGEYWTDHLKTQEHLVGMVQEQSQKVRAAKVKANNPSLSKKERKRHKIDVRQLCPIHGFFSKKIKTTPTPTSASASSTSPPSPPNANPAQPTPYSLEHFTPICTKCQSHPTYSLINQLTCYSQVLPGHFS